MRLISVAMWLTEPSKPITPPSTGSALDVGALVGLALGIGFLIWLCTPSSRKPKDK